jgi:hypothetical protein
MTAHSIGRTQRSPHAPESRCANLLCQRSTLETHCLFAICDTAHSECSEQKKSDTQRACAITCALKMHTKYRTFCKALPFRRSPHCTESTKMSDANTHKSSKKASQTNVQSAGGIFTPCFGAHYLSLWCMYVWHKRMQC